jgi:hypothetical protein
MDLHSTGSDVWTLPRTLNELQSLEWKLNISECGHVQRSQRGKQ